MPLTNAHTIVEDVIAILTGCLIISLGMTFIQFSHTLTGGTIGLALLLHYALNIDTSTLFFLLNLPFYYLAFKRMGLTFVIKTFCAVSMVSLLTMVNVKFIRIAEMPVWQAAVMGNILMGLGLLMLFRHRSSLGGFNILALWLQERYHIKAGNVQMALDILILICSLFLVGPLLLLFSIFGAVALNLIISMNHRPDRYIS